MKRIRRMRWLVVAGGAVSLLALGTGGAMAYGGPPGWPAGDATQTQLTQQDRQQEMLKLHQQLGVPAGQPLHLHDGTGPHGPMPGGNGTGPADCPYRTAS